MKTRDVEFLRAKIELLAEALGHEKSSANFRLFFKPSIELLGSDEKISHSQAGYPEESIDKFARTLLSRADIEKVREQLRARFGFDSLVHKPEAVIARVLKRGRIKDDTEAEVVRDFVANQGNQTELGTEKIERLAEILDEAGY